MKWMMSCKYTNAINIVRRPVKNQASQIIYHIFICSFKVHVVNNYHFICLGEPGVSVGNATQLPNPSLVLDPLPKSRTYKIFTLSQSDYALQLRIYL